VVIAHVVPDTDALGAAFGLATALATDQCRPRISLPDGSLSQRLEFLRDWGNVPCATAGEFAAADAFIVLDTAKKGRCNVEPSLKDTDWSAGRPLINIDHHQTNTRFGTINWVVDTAGSTSELVYYLLRAAERPIPATVASLLYAGIQTDTLGFSLPTTSASALAAAAALAAAGAAVGELGQRLYRSQRLSEFQLLRTIYDNTRVLCDGELAYSSASHDEIHAAGCRAADIDDQISVPRSLIGVRLAMLFTEGNKGKTRINFRGSEDVTVSDLAARFKGGGHLQAAGAVLDMGLQETIELVVPAAVEHLKKFHRPAGGQGMGPSP
jgi:phosphoesterase RecJ-like protein